jgi:hypothetical protein
MKTGFRVPFGITCLMPVSCIAILFKQPHPSIEINETKQKVSTFQGHHKYTPNVNNGNCTHKTEVMN